MENLDKIKYIQAVKRVEQIRGFYVNLTYFIFIMVTCLTINLVMTPAYLWFLYPFWGWGITLLIHGLIVYKKLPFYNEEWEQKKIQQFYEEEKQTLNKLR